MINELDVKKIPCPYCGEVIELVVDCSVAEQEYIEDCQVCCRPINLVVSVNSDGSSDIWASSDDE